MAEKENEEKESKSKSKINFSLGGGGGTTKRKKASTSTSVGFFKGSHRNGSRIEEDELTGAEAAAKETERRKEKGEELVIPLPNVNENDNEKRGSEPLLMNWKRMMEEESDEEDAKAREALLQSAAEHASDSATADHGTNFSADGSSLVIANAGNADIAGKDDKADSIANEDSVKFHRDLKRRAADVDVDSNSYVSVPISEFGAAMLRGMGWTGADQSNDNDDSKSPSLTKPRHHRLGLGANPLPKSLKSNANGSTKDTRRHRVRRPGDLERAKREEEEEDKWRAQMEQRKLLDVQRTLQVGSIVYVASQSGRRARMVKLAGVPGLNRVLVQMEYHSDENSFQQSAAAPLSVKKGDVTLVDQHDLNLKPFRHNKTTHQPDSSLHPDGDTPIKTKGARNEDVDVSLDAYGRKRNQRKSDGISESDRYNDGRTQQSRRNHGPSHDRSARRENHDYHRRKKSRSTSTSRSRSVSQSRNREETSDTDNRRKRKTSQRSSRKEYNQKDTKNHDTTRSTSRDRDSHVHGDSKRDDDSISRKRRHDSSHKRQRDHRYANNDDNDRNERRRNKHSYESDDSDTHFDRRHRDKRSRDSKYYRDEESRHSYHDDYRTRDQERTSRRSRDERKSKRSREDKYHNRDMSDYNRRKEKSRSKPLKEDVVDLHWLIPNIRVRVVTKKVAMGRQFKQKGTVMDVLNKGSEAVLQMADGEVLERVPERYLETALPKVGGNAVILTSGANQYAKGKLLERNSETSKGVIQLFEDMDVVALSLDDIAEWCGPLDDDEME